MDLGNNYPWGYQDACLDNAKGKIEDLSADHRMDLNEMRKSLDLYLTKLGYWAGAQLELLLKSDDWLSNLDEVDSKLKDDPWIKSLVNSYHKVKKANEEEMWELSDTTTEKLTQCLTEVEDTDKWE